MDLYDVYWINSSGNIIDNEALDNGMWHSAAVRPTFYLNSDVTYVSGSGTFEDPIRVN